MRDTVTRQCPQTTTFEEKGELKQIQTEVPLLTSLTPYCWAKPALKSDNGREALQTSMDTKQHCNRDRPTPRERAVMTQPQVTFLTLWLWPLLSVCDLPIPHNHFGTPDGLDKLLHWLGTNVQTLQPQNRIAGTVETTVCLLHTFTDFTILGDFPSLGISTPYNTIQHCLCVEKHAPPFQLPYPFPTNCLIWALL